MPMTPYDVLANDALWESVIVAGLERFPDEASSSADVAASLLPLATTLGDSSPVRVVLQGRVSVSADVRLAYPKEAKGGFTLRGAAVVAPTNPPFVLALFKLIPPLRLSEPGHFAELKLDLLASRVIEE